MERSLSGARIVRVEDGAVVAHGGFCVPPGPMYGPVDLTLRFCTPDEWAWDDVDWNALVAPRSTAVLAGYREARRRLRLAWRLLGNVKDVLVKGGEQ